MKQEFLKEFKALLEKYNVEINFRVADCSDTYGLYNERMVIEHKDETWFETHGWGIIASDIKE